MTHLDNKAIQNLEPRYRAKLINSCSGIRSLNLIGTVNRELQTNLAAFNSVVHIGSNPALLGFILRPTTVRRDTFENIKATNYFTINQVPLSLVEKAHQTSAKYAENESEFDCLKIEKEYISNFIAPFVKSSEVKIGCRYANSYLIEENGCRLVIGKVEHIVFNEKAQFPDGLLDLSQLNTTGSIGTDTYLDTNLKLRLSYAEPHQKPSQI